MIHIGIALNDLMSGTELTSKITSITVICFLSDMTLQFCPQSIWEWYVYRITFLNNIFSPPFSLQLEYSMITHLVPSYAQLLYTRDFALMVAPTISMTMPFLILHSMMQDSVGVNLFALSLQCRLSNTKPHNWTQ